MSTSFNTKDISSRAFWLILVSLWVLLLLLAELRPLSIPDEGRYADIGRWMLLSGDWLVPRLNNIPFFHKPALLHWLLAGAMAVFGVTTWAARLVPALSAALFLVALYVSSRSLVNETVARRATVMLGTSLSFLIGGQYVNHDMLVAAWISVAIWCFALAILRHGRPHAGLARLGFVACALGILSKGLIGLVLPGLVLFTWVIWTRQLRKALQLPWLSGLALFALIAVPWFVLVQRQYPGMFSYMFGVQQFSRYTGNNFNNVQPWWFYGVALCGMLFPWLVFALPQMGATRRVAPGVDERVISLCWCWLIAVVAFFSVPSSKLLGYVLPGLPPLALLAALGWQRCVARWRWSRLAFVSLGALAVALAVAINTLAWRTTKDKLSGDIAKVMRLAMQPEDTVYAVGGYPYDLPFLAQLHRPMVVVQDWSAARAANEDNWRRALYEGVEFDVGTAHLLQTPDVLAAASQVRGSWLVAPKGYPRDGLTDWTEVWVGTGWVLYRATPPIGDVPAPAVHFFRY